VNKNIVFFTYILFFYKINIDEGFQIKILNEIVMYSSVND